MGGHARLCACLAAWAVLSTGCGGAAGSGDAEDRVPGPDAVDRAGGADGVKADMDLSDSSEELALSDSEGSEELALSDSEGSEELALSDSEGSEASEPPQYLPTGFVGTDGSLFRDEAGRVLMLRGVNFANAHKSPPFFASWYTPEEFKKIAARGLNVVRFLIIWAAVEPEPGVFDEAYLDEVEKRVGDAAAAGLYVLLDMHQDLYGPKFGGDGAPLWATLDDGLPYAPQGGQWFLNYGQPAVCRAFENFYANKEGVRDEYAAAWAFVAERFADTPAVVGYDLMNEPWFGEWDFLDPAGFEAAVLMPFYQDLIEAIRTVDANHLVFVEPTTSKGLGSPGGLLPFDDPRLAYAPHYYPPLMDMTGECADTREMMEIAFQQIADDAAGLHMPVLVGEWGLYAGAPGAARCARDQMELLESHLFSNTAWTWDPGGAQLCLLAADMKASWATELLTLPYPVHANAALLSWHYDRPHRALAVKLDPSGWDAGKTEVFLPPTHYPEGPEVTCSEPAAAACDWSFDAATGRLTLTGGEATFGGPFTLTVRPGAAHSLPESGLSTHIPLGDSPAQATELAMEKALGVSVIRTDFWWGGMEPSEGELNLAGYDGLVDHAAGQGIDVLALLDYSVAWAEAVPGDTSTLDPAKFGAFAGKVAAHFADRIDRYEVWNEENLELFFPPAPDPIAYGNLLRAAGDAIHAADPAAQVVFGGLSSAEVFYASGWQFLADALDAHPDLVHCFDVVAIHPYTLGQTVSPEDDLLIGSLVWQIHALREMLGMYGLEYLPILFTELGWPACPCPPLFPPEGIVPNVTREDQARYLVRSWVLAAAAGIAQYLWYDFMDGDGNYPVFSENWFGLVEHDANGSDSVPPEPKESYLAWQALLSRVAGREYAQDLSPSDHCHAHRFTGPQGDLFVVWSSSDDPCLVLLPAAGDLLVEDMYGQPAGEQPAGIPVTGAASPVYVRVE